MELNEVRLIGRLTADPEVEEFKGKVKARFSLAVNLTFSKDKKEVSFIDCDAWGKTAETIRDHVTKGREILVLGRLKQESWEKDGQKRSRLKVVVDRFVFGQRPKDEEGEGRSRSSDSSEDEGDFQPF